MNTFSCYLVFALLVFRAIAPFLPEEELPLLHNDISRGIAEQLGPASERVQSGPLEGGPTPASGRLAYCRDSTRLSERTHDATSVHTGQGTNVQSTLDGQRSQWRDHKAEPVENSRPTVQPNRLVRSLQPISGCIRDLSRNWRIARRMRQIEIEGGLGDTMEFRFDILTVTRILLGVRCALLTSRTGFQQKGQHNLRPGDTIPNTKTLGYMPRPLGYGSEISAANALKKVSLDPAIGMLKAATPTTLSESGPVDVDGIIKEQRVNTNRKKTKDVNNKDHIPSHKSTQHDVGSSTDISEVLLGDPLHTTCVVCHEEFSQPEKNSKNAWLFEKITKMDNCNHYFHLPCIEGWIIEEHKISCPTCRKQVFSPPQYQKHRS
ncbi:hypothetical protein MJO29_009536 [Puccinia striiformis f. sp. tritici]|nr:hypothetical protein MJO29_009536 [Puccinia striiformis f. sp. tritici]